MKIKEFPKIDRPREKLEKYGPEKFSNLGRIKHLDIIKYPCNNKIVAQLKICLIAHP